MNKIAFILTALCLSNFSYAQDSAQYSVCEQDGLNAAFQEMQVSPAQMTVLDVETDGQVNGNVAVNLTNSLHRNVTCSVPYTAYDGNSCTITADDIANTTCYTW